MLASYAAGEKGARAAAREGAAVVVVDAYRASTTIAVLVRKGARVVPVASIEEAAAYPGADYRIGERGSAKVKGFDFGNSPREFTREAVEGKTILLSTTNGTTALVAVQGARDVIVASYVNLSPALAFLRAAARAGADVTIVCSGTDRHFSLEDAALAGRLVRGIARRRPEVELNDAARTCALLDRRYGPRVEELFADASHGRALAAAGFAADLAVCATIDAYPVVPVYVDRQIFKLGPEWER